MINLLPLSDQKELAASRTNTLLIRYVVLVVIFAVLLTAEMAGVYYYLTTERARNQATIDDNAAKTIAYGPTKVDATAFSNNLKIAKYILDQQVPYTTIILKIAKTLPDGSYIDKISIDPKTIGMPTTLSIHTIDDPNKSLEVKTRLLESGLFIPDKGVSIQSTTRGESTSGYPYTVIYTVIFSKDILTDEN